MKGVNTFPKGISPKVNVTAQLKFELAYFLVTVSLGAPFIRPCATPEQNA